MARRGIHRRVAWGGRERDEQQSSRATEQQSSSSRRRPREEQRHERSERCWRERVSGRAHSIALTSHPPPIKAPPAVRGRRETMPRDPTRPDLVVGCVTFWVPSDGDMRFETVQFDGCDEKLPRKMYEEVMLKIAGTEQRKREARAWLDAYARLYLNDEDEGD